MFYRWIQKGCHAACKPKTGKLGQEIGAGFLEHIKGIFIVSRYPTRKSDNPVTISVIKDLKGPMLH